LSEAPAEQEYYSLERYSDDLERIIIKQGLREPILLGHSFGFMPEADYAAKTGNAERLIGISASHNFSKTAPNKVALALFDVGWRGFEYVCSLLTGISHIVKGEERDYPDHSNLEGKGDMRVFLSIVDVPFSNIKRYHIAGRQHVSSDISQQLAEIKKPMLLIYKSGDLMVPKRAGDEIRKINPGAEVEVIKGSGHSLPITRPDAVLNVLQKYL
jgi:pimeloyl-ACP methyl ester carboxylesterase